MASTPLKSHWDSNIAEHGFGSPFSDTGTSQSQNSTNTVQYINSQLVAHGYAQSPGISTEGLSRADEEKLVKCLLSMLSQRMDDMSRAEDFSAKLRTSSYENERLSSLYNSCKEELATAEKNVNLYKSRLNATTKSLQAAETAHKLTTGELQRTRTTLQSVRQTHAAEVKRREKENERMVERWAKLAESQLKIASIPSGMTFHPFHAKAQPNTHFWANSAVATKDGEVIGRGPDLLETALEEAEQNRKGLEEENRRMQAVVVDCANQLARMLNSLRTRGGRSGEEAPIFTIESMFPVSSAHSASRQLDSLIGVIRENLMDRYTTPQEDDSPSPSPRLKTSSLRTGEARSRDRECEQISNNLERESQKLQEVVDGLRRDIEKVSERTYTGKLSNLFQNLNDNGMNDDDEQQDIRRSTTPPLVDTDLNVYLPDDNELGVDQLPPRPRRKSVKFRSPKPHRSPARARSSAQVGGGSPKTLRSPHQGGRKSTGQAMKSSVKLGFRQVIPAYETEIVPPVFNSNGKGATSTSFVSSAFVLPPPSPMASLPQRGDLLTSFVPQMSKVDRDNAAERDLLMNTTVPVGQTGIDSRHSETETDVSTTPPTLSVPEAMGQPPGRRPFNYPVAKPFAKGMIHAYSPARPSPLSRILLLSQSPDSNPDIAPGTALEALQEEDGDGWMDEDELVTKARPSLFSGECVDEESPLRDKATKSVKSSKSGAHKSRSSMTASARASYKEKPLKSIKEKLMGVRAANVVASSSQKAGKEKIKGKASVSSMSSSQVRNTTDGDAYKENAHANMMHQQRGHGIVVKDSKRSRSATDQTDNSFPMNNRDTNRTSTSVPTTSSDQAKPSKRSQSKARHSPPPVPAPTDPAAVWGSAADVGVHEASDPDEKSTQSQIHPRKVSSSSVTNKPLGSLGTLKSAVGGPRRVPIGSAEAGPVGPGWR